MASVKAWVLVGSLLAGSPSVAADAVDSLRFGRHLLRQGDPYRAITEFERARFQAPAGRVAAEASWLIAVAYLEGGRWEPALAALERHRATHPQQPSPGLQARALAHARLFLDDTAAWDALQALDPPASGDVAAQRHQALGSALAAAGQRQWPLAAELLAAVPEGLLPASDDRVRVDQALQICREAARDPAPSPLLAGLGSALLPGLGQTLAGRPGDGFFALLLPAALAGWAISLHQAGQAAPGNVAAVGAGILYLGNIQGGINAAVQARRVLPRRRAETVFERLEPLVRDAMAALLQSTLEDEQ